jgi:hypothetical protein
MEEVVDALMVRWLRAMVSRSRGRELWTPHEMALNRFRHRHHRREEYFDVGGAETGGCHMFGASANRLVFQRQRYIRQHRDPTCPRGHQQRGRGSFRAPHGCDNHIGIKDTPHRASMSHHRRY